MKIRTEFNFVLPRAMHTDEGREKKVRGVMRLVKVKDLIEVSKDMRVKTSPAYFYVVVLTKVVENLSTEKLVNTKAIEKLAPEDFAFLVDFFNEINHRVITNVPAECTGCGNKYIGEINLVGEV